LDEKLSTTEQLASEFRRRTRPSNELPAIVALDAALARTDDIVIALSGARAYTQGIELFLRLHVRQPGAVSATAAFAGLHGGGSDQYLLGVEFADGRTATNIDDSPSDDNSTTAVLMSCGGGGSPDFSSHTYYLTPVPPPGRLSIIVAWPAAGIGEHRVELDAEPFRSAAERAQVLWPEQPTSTWNPPSSPRPDLAPGGWFAHALS
jgi:hypothetical protein